MPTVAFKVAACLPSRYLTEAISGPLGGGMLRPLGETTPLTLILSVLLAPVDPFLAKGHGPFFTSNSGRSARYTTCARAKRSGVETSGVDTFGSGATFTASTRHV